MLPITIAFIYLAGSVMVMGGALRTLHTPAYSRDRLRVMCATLSVLGVATAIVALSRTAIDRAAGFYLLAAVDLIVAAGIFFVARKRRPREA